MMHVKRSFVVLFLPLLFILTSMNSGAITKNQEAVSSSTLSDLNEGHFLYSPIFDTTSYLINETGVITHTWSSNYTANLDSYLLNNGIILRPILSGNGGFQKIAWNNTILWEYHYTRDSSYASHDVVPLPNGDVIMIMQEIKSRTQAIQAGRDPNTVGANFYPDFLIQVHQTGPTTGVIVWEWHVWDHLIQDYDATKDNYGNVSDHPELININFGEDFMDDWLHMNSVDYNPEYDQLLLSAHNFDEAWIIDHSTTTEQAARHQGGMYQHGGDLLYRWGNPQAYNRGDATNKHLFFQHQCCWIKPGLPGAGNILVFSNGNNEPDGPYSTVDEFTPPINSSGEYPLLPNGVYGPQNATWHYRLSNDLYANIWSGAQRMLNGNTLICSGTTGTFIEVTPSNDIVWTYVNPFPPNNWNWVYRTQYIPPQRGPKLQVTGVLYWSNIKPGATVTGSFQVQNDGSSASRLNWTINTSSLTWGIWTFSPLSGSGLTPQDGPVTINVSCVVPYEKHKEFHGMILVQDHNNTSDNGSVLIVLQTPASTPNSQSPFFLGFWRWVISVFDAWKTFFPHLTLIQHSVS